MDLWYPPDDQPQLHEWWVPLLNASRAARLDRCPWPIHIDEVMLMGRVDRPSRPAIWIYKHIDSRRELYLDATGQAYKFTRTPKGRSLGRFTPCDIRTAVWRADLPAFVEPVWFDEPRLGRGAWVDGEQGEVDAAGGRHIDPPEHARPAHRPPTPRARRHLTLVVGGRPLAG
jgi:hypothetical protein